MSNFINDAINKFHKDSYCLSLTIKSWLKSSLSRCPSRKKWRYYPNQRSKDMAYKAIHILNEDPDVCYDFEFKVPRFDRAIIIRRRRLQKRAYDKKRKR